MKGVIEEPKTTKFTYGRPFNSGYKRICLNCGKIDILFKKRKYCHLKDFCSTICRRKFVSKQFKDECFQDVVIESRRLQYFCDEEYRKNKIKYVIKQRLILKK